VSRDLYGANSKCSSALLAKVFAGHRMAERHDVFPVTNRAASLSDEVLLPIDVRHCSRRTGLGFPADTRGCAEASNCRVRDSFLGGLLRATKREVSNFAGD
jgi:hypothetical protein